MCLESVNKLDHIFYLKPILKINKHNDVEKEINYKRKESANNWYFLLWLQDWLATQI